MIFQYGPFPTLVYVVTTMYRGVTNAAPITWVSPISYEPPLIMISVKKESDTVRNIMNNGKFVVQTVPYHMAQKIHNMAKSYPRDISELSEQKLATVKESILSVPRLVLATDWYECVSKTIHMYGNDHCQVIGKVKHYKRNKIDRKFASCRPLLYCGGLTYNKEESTDFDVDPY